MDVLEVRRKNLDAMIGNPGVKGRIVAFARKHDLDASYLSQVLNGHRTLGEKAARSLENKVGTLSGSLDIDRSGLEIRDASAEYVISRRLRPDQLAILEGYEKSSRDVKKAALRLFGVVEEIDNEERN